MMALGPGGVVDTGYYEGQRRGIEEEYAANVASNTYSRFLSKTRGERGLGDMQRGFGRAFPSFSAQFGQRGMGGAGIRSGVMQRAMGDYLGDYTRGFSNTTQDLTEQLRQFDLENAQLGARRTSALADLDMDKAREIAFAAQNIEALRQILGAL